jgi:predicted polyphosphate/ATP-dependent NAD kinase
MGETAARDARIEATVVGELAGSETRPDDTVRAARALVEANCDLLVFAGGDGTARDILGELKQEVPVLGIPAGVKMHSGVFATSPESAARLIALFAKAERGTFPLRTAEVMDIDEAAFRDNRVSAALYGYLRVPNQSALLQAAKSARAQSDSAALDALTVEFERTLSASGVFLVAGGSTTHHVVTKLGLDKTLLGIDAIEDKKIIGKDLNEEQIHTLTKNTIVWIVVSVIGSQGYIFGRGNQQLSPDIIKRAGKDHIIVLATLDKLATLAGRRLLVDTGDAKVDLWLAGHIKIHVGYRHQVVMPVGS